MIEGLPNLTTLALRANSLTAKAVSAVLASPNARNIRNFAIFVDSPGDLFTQMAKESPKFCEQLEVLEVESVDNINLQSLYAFKILKELIIKPRVRISWSLAEYVPQDIGASRQVELWTRLEKLYYLRLHHSGRQTRRAGFLRPELNPSNQSNGVDATGLEALLYLNGVTF